jgi:hypothetical protein
VCVRGNRRGSSLGDSVLKNIYMGFVNQRRRMQVGEVLRDVGKVSTGTGIFQQTFPNCGCTLPA